MFAFGWGNVLKSPAHQLTVHVGNKKSVFGTLWDDFREVVGRYGANQRLTLKIVRLNIHALSWIAFEHHSNCKTSGSYRTYSADSCFLSIFAFYSNFSAQLLKTSRRSRMHNDADVFSIRSALVAEKQLREVS